MFDGQQGADLVAGDGPGYNKSHVFDLLYLKGFACWHKYKAFSEEEENTARLRPWSNVILVNFAIFSVTVTCR